MPTDAVLEMHIELMAEQFGQSPYETDYDLEKFRRGRAEYRGTDKDLAHLTWDEFLNEIREEPADVCNQVAVAPLFFNLTQDQKSLLTQIYILGQASKRALRMLRNAQSAGARTSRSEEVAPPAEIADGASADKPPCRSGNEKVFKESHTHRADDYADTRRPSDATGASADKPSCAVLTGYKYVCPECGGSECTPCAGFHPYARVRDILICVDCAHKQHRAIHMVRADNDVDKPVAISDRAPKTVAEEMRQSPWLIEPAWRTDEASTDKQFNPDYRVPLGETIKGTLTAMGYEAYWLAEQVGYDLWFVQRLLDGDAKLTDVLANKLEVVLGIPAPVLLRLEANYRKPIDLSDKGEEMLGEALDDVAEGRIGGMEVIDNDEEVI